MRWPLAEVRGLWNHGRAFRVTRSPSRSDRGVAVHAIAERTVPTRPSDARPWSEDTCDRDVGRGNTGRRGGREGSWEAGRPAAERRPHPDRRPGLDRPGLLRQRPSTRRRTSTGWRRRGMRFTNAYSACTGLLADPRPAILTGKYPARLHVTDWIPGREPPKAEAAGPPTGRKHLPLEEVTLAEALEARGLRSASIGKWHLGDGPVLRPRSRASTSTSPAPRPGTPPSYFSPYKIPTLPDGPPGEYLTDRLDRPRPCRFIEANQRPAVLPLPAALRRAHPAPGQARAGRRNTRRRSSPGMRAAQRRSTRP